MMPRSKLQNKSLEELQALGKKYGIQPIGSYRNHQAWIHTLSRFPYKAIDQMRDGIGLHSPGIEAYRQLTALLDLFGEPTDSQAALIRATHTGDWIDDPDLRFYQEKLFELWRMRFLLMEVKKLMLG
ncbi:hypothetical protein [Fischerella sp. PCC 9605]|uniref:hypothetical protein n=1 Tax=Fischerella sp. PCC 9605 TaxID=1173024 RepID=UPI00047AC276|nr:hypothetical protein [Fischerella sp. PCC 9605]